MKQKKVLLVDSDGVLAIYNNFKDFRTKGFFNNLDPYENFIKALKDPKIKDRYTIYIFTSCPDCQDSINDKNEFYDRYTDIPKERRIFVSYDDPRSKIEQFKDRYDLIPGTVYIDDYHKNLTEARRIFKDDIILVNAVPDDEEHTWKGNRINIESPVQNIIDYLIYLSERE
jgi:5'(3')-deoxyribonucleotidase